MTTPRRTKRRAVLERNRDKIIPMVVDGAKDADIARQFKAAKSSVHDFMRRHADEIEALRAELRRRVDDVLLRDKERRIREADGDYWRTDVVVQARAADTRYNEPGYASGTMVHSLKQLGGGENATIVDEYKVDTALLAERRALRREVAEQLGELPKPTLNVIQDNRSYVLNWDDGTPAQ